MRLDNLFHWSPADRRETIRVAGLRPGMAPTTCAQPVEYLCLGMDPRRAWLLSGEQGFTKSGPWDLWQVELDSEIEVRLRVEDGRLKELMVHSPIPPSRLWLVGTKDKPHFPGGTR